jgi:exo-beta-1,3-glucanase (GH17 family)
MLVACLAAALVLGGQALATNQAAAQQARATVVEARDAVESAARKGALWTTAQDALKRAEEALAQKDYVTAERLAQFAVQQARLGIEQLGYPHFQ